MDVRTAMIPPDRLKSREIICKTEELLRHAWHNKHDFGRLREYHDVMDVKTFSIRECVAVIRSCCRVRSMYSHWFIMRDRVLENLRANPELDESQVQQLMGGLMDPAPTPTDNELSYPSS